MKSLNQISRLFYEQIVSSKKKKKLFTYASHHVGV